MASPNLRICETIFSSPWSDLAGGGQMSVHEQATALYELGHEVHVLYSRWKREATVPRASYQVHLTHQFDCGDINIDALSFLLSLKRLTQKHRFDVLHSNAEEGLFNKWIARSSGAVCVSTFHGSQLPHDSFVQRFLRTPLSFTNDLDYSLLRSTLQRADHVIALGEYGKRILLDALGESHRHKISVIPPGIDSSWFSGEYRGCPPGEMRLVTWSRLVPRKGIEDIIAATTNLSSRLPDFIWTIFGNGEAASEYKEEAKRLGLLKHLRFVGKASASAIQAFALGCHAAIFPSHSEGFSRGPHEAAALGLPIIATRVGSIDERFKNGEGILMISPGDVDELCQAILTIWRYPAYAVAMGSVARQAVMGLTWSANGIRTLELYQSILSQHRNDRYCC